MSSLSEDEVLLRLSSLSEDVVLLRLSSLSEDVVPLRLSSLSEDVVPWSGGSVRAASRSSLLVPLDGPHSRINLFPLLGQT